MAGKHLKLFSEMQIAVILLLSLIGAFPASGHTGEENISVRIVQSYDKDFYASRMDSLKKEFGNNKLLPEGFELQALLALSHYPELKDVKIKFVIRPAHIPLTSHPNVATVFLGKKNREYIIMISSQSAPYNDSILLKNLSFNSQIGVLGHELAHTVFYLDKTPDELLTVGFNYLFPRYRASFEKDTDKRTIRHGLGWQLYEYARYVRDLQETNVYNNWVDKYYLNPELILEYMKKIPAYNIQ